MTKLVKKTLKILIPLVLGITIVYFLYRDVDIAQLWNDIKKANWTILSISLIFSLLASVIRALRWGQLFRTLGYQPRRSNLIFAVMGNYAVNFAIPRAGDVWRCAVIHRKEKIPVSKIIETWMVDRIMDVLPVILFGAIAIGLNWVVLRQNSELFQIPAWLQSPYLYLGIAILLLIVGLVLIFWKNNPLIQFLRPFWKYLKKDMRIILKMDGKTKFFVYTFGIWISFFLCFFVAFFAFDFTAGLGFSAALFIFVLGSVSMLIPSNGGLGPWQAAVVFGLCAFLVNRESAIVFATVVFAFQSLWQVLCGLFGIFSLAIRKNA